MNEVISDSHREVISLVLSKAIFSCVFVEITHRHTLEKICLEANELVRLLLNNFRAQGRPQSAS
jgi:hypothetical protein